MRLTSKVKVSVRLCVCPNSIWGWASPILRLLILFIHSNIQTPRASSSTFSPKWVRLTLRSRSAEYLSISWITEFEISIFTQFYFTQQLWNPRSDHVSFLFQIGWQYGRYRQIRHAESLCISVPLLQRNALFYLMQLLWRNWIHNSTVVLNVWCRFCQEMWRVVSSDVVTYELVVQRLPTNMEECEFWSNDIWTHMHWTTCG